jgi:hypothetical protein
VWSLIKSNLDFYPQLLSINCSFDNGSWWIKMSNNTQQKVELTIQCQISETYWLLISQFKKFTVNWNSYIQGLRIKYQYNFCNKCLVQGWFQFLSKGFLSYSETTPAKGQFISKANFLVLICTKNPTKYFFDFCLSL